MQEEVNTSNVRKSQVCRRFVFAVVAAFLTWGSNAYQLENKALVPVKITKSDAKPQVGLVRGGVPQFVLVARKDRANWNSSISRARYLLQHVFEKTTGAKPELVTAEDEGKWKSAAAVVFVGDSAPVRELGVDYHALPDQGFVVKTFPRKGDIPPGVMIVGNDTDIDGKWTAGKVNGRMNSLATFYGAVDFAERILGCRWYFPGELGCIYPECRDLTLGSFEYSDAPYFNTRGNPFAFYSADKAGWKGKPWQEVLGPWENIPQVGIQDLWRLGRTMQLLGKHQPEPIPVAKAFPDRVKDLFYTTPSGRLMQSIENYFGNYYDVMNLEKDGFAEFLVDQLKRFYASDGAEDKIGLRGLTGIDYVNFGVTDVFLNPEDYIAHPTVKALNLVRREDYERGDPRAIMANVYGRFYEHLCRRLAEELPGKKLFILAYYNCRYAPTRYRMPENFDAIVCDGSLLSFCMEKGARSRSRALFKGWYDAMGGRAPGMAYLYGAGGSPLAHDVTCEYIGECVRLLGPYLGRIGIFYDGTFSWSRYWALYAGAHQEWNPDFDPVASFDEMAWLMVGAKAAPHLVEFHNRVRTAVEKYTMPHSSHPKTTPPCPEKEIAAMESCLAEAKACLAPGSVEMRRFEVFCLDWPGAFEKMRGELKKKQADGKGVYDVERKSGKTVDWEKIAPVPGSNGLKFVWDEKGLYGRADGEVHYTLATPWLKGADERRLDYDTMVPGFSFAFDDKFRAKVYKAVELRPFGRLRLLGEGDRSKALDDSRPSPKCDLDGEITLTATGSGRGLSILGGARSYSFFFNRLPGDARQAGTCYSLQTGVSSPLFGMHVYSKWFQLSVNGISMGEVDFGAENLSTFREGVKAGFEYALNFDGARVRLRFFMKKGKELLLGELLPDPASTKPVESVVLRLSAIPSGMVGTSAPKDAVYKREVRTATRLVERDAPLAADDRFFILQDANLDGTSPEKGMGPTMAVVDWRGVLEGKAEVRPSAGGVGLEFRLDPKLEHAAFGVWQDTDGRHSNEEVFKKFSGK